MLKATVSDYDTQIRRNGFQVLLSVSTCAATLWRMDKAKQVELAHQSGGMGLLTVRCLNPVLQAPGFSS